jgi:hypothetical protein
MSDMTYIGFAWLDLTGNPFGCTGIEEAAAFATSPARIGISALRTPER